MLLKNRVVIAALLTFGVAAALGAAVRAASAPRPAAISHVVLFKLHDPAERSALIAECDEILANIPSVVSYACGEPLDLGRPSVDGDYHVGLYVGFDDEAGYKAYRFDDGHIDLARKWKSKSETMRIFDFVDPTE